MTDHPLFPPKDDDPDDEAPEVASLHVTRGGDWCPRLFDAEELTSLEQLHELFGGGLYELVARGSNGRVSARRRYKLPGAPKPLDGSGGGQAAAPPPNGAPSAPGQAPPGFGQDLGGHPSVLALLFQMLQNQASQQQAFMVAMLDRSQSSTQTLLQAMTTAQQSSAQMMAQVMGSALEAKSGGDPSALYLKGITDAGELLRGFKEGASDDDGGGMQDLKTAAEAFSMAMHAANAGGPPPQAEHAPPSPHHNQVPAAPPHVTTEGEAAE